MMTRLLLFVLALGLSANAAWAQITDPKATEVYFPQPRKVTPGTTPTAAPSDAIVLFDGSNFTEWQHLDGKAVQWTLDGDGAMTVKGGTGNIKTKRVFGDMQLHLEFRSPISDADSGQLKGNSGVFLQERYEVQILDNYTNTTYSNGQATAIYKQTIPLVNACKPTGEWQTYDILYTAPRFNRDGIKVASAYVTVIHNGIVVQHHTEIQGTTEYIGLPQNPPHEKASLMLQDHGDLVSFRNIWVREL